jgi:hypothetical protein
MCGKILKGINRGFNCRFRRLKYKLVYDPFSVLPKYTNFKSLKSVYEREKFRFWGPLAKIVSIHKLKTVLILYQVVVIIASISMFPFAKHVVLRAIIYSVSVESAAAAEKLFLDLLSTTLHICRKKWRLTPPQITADCYK